MYTEYTLEVKQKKPTVGLHVGDSEGDVDKPKSNLEYAMKGYMEGGGAPDRLLASRGDTLKVGECLFCTEGIRDDG